MRTPWASFHQPKLPDHLSQGTQGGMALLGLSRR